jgi:hypothetical protein
MPTCWIVAGRNGADKTTFALKYLPAIAGCTRFINADLIAAGLSPLAPNSSRVAATRLFLKEIVAAFVARTDFALETTLTGRRHLQLVRQLRSTRECERANLIPEHCAIPSVNAKRRQVYFGARFVIGSHKQHTPNRSVPLRYFTLFRVTASNLLS